MVKNSLQKLLLLMAFMLISINNSYSSDTKNSSETEREVVPDANEKAVEVKNETEKPATEAITKNEEVKPVAEHKYTVKVGGFLTVRSRWDDVPGNNPGFDLRFARLTLSGKLTPDFSYKFQSEFVGTVRILDLMLGWNKYEFFNVTAGQQKRNFTFENYLAPFAITVSDYSQNVLNLGGFFDRVGEHACGGRDVGVTVSGEFFKTGNHNLFKYALGVFNGEGINKTDKNKGKDLIGSLYIQPVKDLFIGGGYWDGEFGPDSISVDRKRWTVGVSYSSKGYIFRSEYIASKGGILEKDNVAMASDGWYAVAEVPVFKKFGVGAKYDLYRDDKTMKNATIKYYGSLNWYINKYVILQGCYCFTDDRAKNTDYNGVAVQLFFRY